MKRFVVLLLILVTTFAYAKLERIQAYDEDSLPILNENFRSLNAKGPRLDHLERHTEIISLVDGKLEDNDEDTSVMVETTTTNSADEVVYSDDDTIRFTNGGTEQLFIVDGFIKPTTNDDIDFGDTDERFSDAWFTDTINIGDDADDVQLTYDTTDNQLDINQDSNIEKATPELRLTDTGDDEYSRYTYTDTSHQMNIYCRAQARTGQSLDFDDNISYGHIASAESWAKEQYSNVTYAAWIRPDAIDSSSGIIHHHGRIRLNVTGDNTSWIYFETNTQVGQATGITLNVDTWYRIVATWASDGTIEIYLNGVDVGGDSGNGAPEAPSAAGLVIGYGWTGSYHFAGIIDEVEIYSEIKDQTWVTADYNSGSGVSHDSSESGIEMLYHFNEGEGATAGDSSGNSRDLSISAQQQSHVTWSDTALVTVAGDMHEVSVVQSEDADAIGINSINTFSDTSSKTVLEGNTIRFNDGGTEQMLLDDGVLKPTTDNDVDIGASTLEWKDFYLDGLAYVDGFGEDTDLGDFDIHSLDGLYGIDDNVYIDMGTDGYLDLEADTQIRITAPTDMGDEDITSADKIEFYDTAIYVDGGADGYLDIAADTAVRCLNNFTVTTGKNITLGSTQWNTSDNIDGEQIGNDTIDDDSIDWTDVTSTDMTFDADTVLNTAVYTGTTSLEETTGATDSGAYIVGCYDEFAYSTGTDVQTVLDDLDAKIGDIIGGSAEFSGSLIPDTDDSYDLGETTTPKEWRNAYFDGTMEADIITENGNAVYNSSETPGGELGGTWASPTVDSGIHDDEYIELADSFGGDVSGTYDNLDVTDDGHAHTGSTISGLDISDDTNLTAGDFITLTDDDLDVDTAAVTNGDITHVPTCDGTYDFCETTQDYLKTSENSDTDDDVTNDNVETMATAGGSGTAPLSDGVGGLSMTDVWTEAENTAAGYISSETDDQTIDVFSISGNNIQLSLESDGEATKTVDISSTTAVAANTAVSHTQNTDTTVVVGDSSIVITDTGANGTITEKVDNTEVVHKNISETVYNDSGADMDFRVESDTKTNALLVDGATGNIGVGATPESWDTGYSAIRFGTQGSMFESAGQMCLSFNLYRDSVDSRWERIAAGGVQFISQQSAGTYFYGAGTTDGGSGANSPISFTELFGLTTAEVYVNNGGADLDFRVEGDTETHALFVQGSDNYVGVWDSSPSYELDVTGDIHCTGKLTSDGGNDPPYVLYNRETRQQIIDRILLEVPPDKLGGAVMFYNSEDDRMEIFIPNRGEFRGMSGVVLSKCKPIKATFDVKNKLYFNRNSGEVDMLSVPVEFNKYRLADDVMFNQDIGVFVDTFTGDFVPPGVAIQLNKEEL